MAANDLPNFIVVDLGLPDGDGAELIRRVREGSPIPIFVLSGRDRLQEEVAGLNAGADDYLTKLFVPNELRARIRAALRRMTARDRPVATARRPAAGSEFVVKLPMLPGASDAHVDFEVVGAARRLLSEIA